MTNASHAVHRILALWTVGADGALIEAGYETDTSYLRKTYASPNAITQANFKDHLGDHKYVNNDHLLNISAANCLPRVYRYWSAYLEFFSRETLDLGLPGVLEKYIFSREFNIHGEKSPRMLDRFFSGLLHPFIHTAHGYEFGLPGIVAEGMYYSFPRCLGLNINNHRSRFNGPYRCHLQGHYHCRLFQQARSGRRRCCCCRCNTSTQANDD